MRLLAVVLFALAALCSCLSESGRNLVDVNGLESTATTTGAKVTASFATFATNFLNNYRGKIDINLISNYMTSDTPSQTAKNYIQSYTQGIVVFCGLGVVFIVLTLLWTLFFIIGRCCCGKCGGKFPPQERIMDGYTGFERLIPFCCFFLFGLLAVALSAFGYFAIGTFASGVTDLQLAVNVTLWNSTAYATTISNDLLNVKTSMDVVISSGSNAFSGTNAMNQQINNLIQESTSFSTGVSQVTTFPISFPFNCTTSSCSTPQPCRFCSTLGSDVGSLTTALNTNIKPMINNIVSTANSLSNELNTLDVSILNSAIAETVVAAAVLQNSSLQVNSLYGQVTGPCQSDSFNSCATKVSDLAEWSLIAYAALFLLSLLGIIFVWLSRKLSICLWISWGCTSFIAILGFAIAAFLLPTAIVMNDGCTIMSAAVTGPGGFNLLVSPVNAAILNAMMHDQSLLAALNASAVVDLAKTLQYPPPVNNTKFNMDSLNQLKTISNSLTVAQLGFNQANWLSQLYYLNSLAGCCKPNYENTTNTGCDPGCSYPGLLSTTPVNSWDYAYGSGGMTEATVQDLNSDGLINVNDQTFAQTNFGYNSSDPTSLGTQIYVQWLNVTNTLQIKLDMTSFIKEFNMSTIQLNSDILAFQANLTSFSSSIDALKTGPVGNLIHSVSTLTNNDCGSSGSCKFVMDDYNAVNYALCDEMVSSVLLMAICFFFASLFLLIPSGTLICLQKRLGPIKAPVHVGMDVKVRAIE